MWKLLLESYVGKNTDCSPLGTSVPCRSSQSRKAQIASACVSLYPVRLGLISAGVCSFFHSLLPFHVRLQRFVTQLWQSTITAIHDYGKTVRVRLLNPAQRRHRLFHEPLTVSRPRDISLASEPS